MAKSADTPTQPWEAWRKWLENNKIFLEAGAMVALTLMSVIVGISANNIADSQLRVEKINHQPVFEFNRYTDSNKSFEWLNVYNTGFSTESIDFCEPMPLLRIHYRDEEQNTKMKLFVLEGYYDVSHSNLPGDNGLYQFGNVWFDHNHENFNYMYEREEGNRFKYLKLANEIARYKNSTVDTYGYSVSVFVHIKYTDMYGDSHEGLYSADGPTLYKIPDKDFKNTLRYIEQLEDDDYIVDLNNYSPKQIHGKLMEDPFPLRFSF